MPNINVFIFPVDKYSIIMAFNDKRYRNNYNFIKKFKEKTLEEKLYILNYILLYYTEDYYLSPNIVENIKQNKNLISLCSDLNLVIGDASGEIMPEIKKQN